MIKNFREAARGCCSLKAKTTAKAGLCLLLLPLILLFVSSSGAGAVVDDPDVDTAATYTYLVDPGAGVVKVTVELAVTADKPNLNLADGSFYEYYFDGYFFLVPSVAEELTVLDSAGRTLDYAVEEESEDFKVLRIDFVRNIFYRQTSNITLTFDLPGDAVRSDELARVNEAYAGFSVWVDPQLEQASVEVIIPDGFEDSSTGTDRFSVDQTEDGSSRFFVTDVDPEEFWAIASLSRESSLVETELEVDGYQIRIRSWPGDDAWTDHVVDSLENGLPNLIDSVGLDWPIDDELTIVESYSPYILGFAGWYDPRINEIEIGDELDDHVVFHELSHVWFNEGLFDYRWITEGLADEFAAHVVAAGGEDLPDPPRILQVNDNAQPLNEWREYSGVVETEIWAYGASWTVTRAVVDRVGIDVLSEVVKAAANDEISYLGDADPEPGREKKDWRLYLDLIENRGDVDDGEIADLFQSWVLAEGQMPFLEDRAASRERYLLLEETGDTWAPPLGVRTELTDWKFSAAEEAMDNSFQLLEQRTSLLNVLEPLDAAMPVGLEESYESAASFTEADATMADAIDVGRTLAASQTKLTDADSLFERIGSIGTDLPVALDAAVQTYESGDTEKATRQAGELDSAVEGLARTGLYRVAIAAGLLLLLLVLFVLIFRRRRSRRRHNNPQSTWSAT